VRDGVRRQLHADAGPADGHDIRAGRLATSVHRFIAASAGAFATEAQRAAGAAEVKVRANPDAQRPHEVHRDVEVAAVRGVGLVSAVVCTHAGGLNRAAVVVSGFVPRGRGV
jgi:hypothetical protein